MTDDAFEILGEEFSVDFESRGEKFSIREANADDCKALATLDSRIFSEPLSENGFHAELSNALSTTLVALKDGIVIGYCNFWNVCGEVTLNNIAVDEAFRKRSIGSALLRSMFTYMGVCDFITLEVRKSNEGAIKLYKRFGFETVGERKNFYRMPTEDALLMTIFSEKISKFLSEC